MNDEDTQDVQPQGIPRFDWVSSSGAKGWAIFNDPDLLTGRDTDALRKAYGSSPDNAGEGTNAFMKLAFELLIHAWEIPGKPQAKTPRYDKKGEWLSQIPGKMKIKLEMHISPYLEFITKAGAQKDEEQDNGPGSPSQPESV
jgi:hypothetical protein